MALHTVAGYRDVSRDSRHVIYQGRAVPDVTESSELDTAISYSALGHDIAALEPELATADDGNGPYTAFYKVPRTADEVARHGQLIESFCRLGTGTIVLNEVGSELLGVVRSATNGRPATCRTDGDRRQGYRGAGASTVVWSQTQSTTPTPQRGLSNWLG